MSKEIKIDDLYISLNEYRDKTKYIKKLSKYCFAVIVLVSAISVYFNFNDYKVIISIGLLFSFVLLVISIINLNQLHKKIKELETKIYQSQKLKL